MTPKKEKSEDKERKRLYEYAVKIGFVKTIKKFSELTEKKKIERIEELLEEGYRLEHSLFGDDLFVVNTKKKYKTVQPKEVRDEMLEIYNWLTSENDPKAEKKGQD